jgi:glutaredoxin
MCPKCGEVDEVGVEGVCWLANWNSDKCLEIESTQNGKCDHCGYANADADEFEVDSDEVDVEELSTKLRTAWGKKNIT